MSQRKISTLIVVNAVPRISLPQDKTTLLQLGDDAPPSAPPGVNAKAFARGEELFKNLWEYIGSKWKRFTSQPRSRQPEVLQHTALTYLQDHTNVYDRACMRVYLTASKTETGIGGQLRELVIALPEKQFHGTVYTVQAAPDKALRQNPAGTTEPQMLRSRTLRAAKREVVRRQERQTKPRPARVNHQRIGKTSMTLWVDPKLLARIDHIAEKQDLTRQDFLAHMLEYVATQYEHGPKGSTKVFDEAAAELRRLEKTVRRVAGTLAVSTLVHK